MSDFRIGDPVVYIAHDGKREDGVVTSVNERFVFVRFVGMYPNAPGKACDRRRLMKPSGFTRVQ